MDNQSPERQDDGALLDLQSLIQTIPAALFSCSYDPTQSVSFDYVSPQMSTLLGIAAQDVIDRTGDVWTRLTEADQQNLKAAIDSAKDQGTGWTWVVEYPAAGSRGGGWLEWRAEPASARHPDAPARWYGIVTDISHHMQMETRRRAHRELYQQTVVDLAKNPEVNGADQQRAFQIITETLSTTMPVQRASIWLYNNLRNGIECVNLYDAGEKKHSAGIELSQRDYPNYFEAIKDGRLVIANNAHTHPATAEFSEGYLKPLGIDSMIDAAIRIRQEVIGIVCCEHVNGTRNWEASEESFVSSIADLVALVIEQQRRREDQQLQYQLQQQVIDMQQAAIAELSTPIIPFSDEIILLPLIGSINTQRAQQIIDVLLDAVSQLKAHIVILDLTGVPSVDTHIASALIRAAQSVQLLGARTIVTGIRPDIAQTLISLGVDLQGINTESNLQSGISLALKHQRNGG
jgi:anti-anti-sigma regulatory factor